MYNEHFKEEEVNSKGIISHITYHTGVACCMLYAYTSSIICCCVVVCVCTSTVFLVPVPVIEPDTTIVQDHVI
jgi:hypothetical protein